LQAIFDTSLLVQLRNEQSSSYELLYKFYFPSIASYIKQNQGNKEDAEGIFQEAIIVLLNKVRQDDFELSSFLKTYLVAIVKNLWLKRLRDNKLITVEDESVLNRKSTETIVLEMYPEKTEEEKVENWLTKITINCQNLLKAIFFYNESMDSLMSKMVWKNKHTAANQKYKCMEQIKRETLKWA